MKKLVRYLGAALAVWAGVYGVSLVEAQETADHTATASSSLARYSVVQVYTHGCSMTCVYTDSRVSYFIGCGHGETPKDQVKPHGITLHVPPGFLAPQPTKTTVIASSPCRDKRSPNGKDLSLIKVDAGPFPYVTPIAPKEWSYQGKHLISCGYDEGKWHARPCSILQLDHDGYYETRERPWHGRSGGGLIDEDNNYLVGVVSGYIPVAGNNRQEVIDPRHPGIYAGHRNIVNFVEQQGYGWLIGSGGKGTPITPLPQSPVPYIDSKPEYIDIPPAIRVRNASGIQCGWVSIETIARYLGVTQLYGISQQERGFSDPVRVASVLERRGVPKTSFSQQRIGSKDKSLIKRALALGWPVAVGLGREHVQVLVGMDESSVWLLSNTTDKEVHKESVNSFDSRWDGWVICIGKGVPTGYQSQPQYPPSQPQPQQRGAPSFPQRDAPPPGCLPGKK